MILKQFHAISPEVQPNCYKKKKQLKLQCAAYEMYVERM